MVAEPPCTKPSPHDGRHSPERAAGGGARWRIRGPEPRTPDRAIARSAGQIRAGGYHEVSRHAVDPFPLPSDPSPRRDLSTTDLPSRLPSQPPEWTRAPSQQCSPEEDPAAELHLGRPAWAHIGVLMASQDPVRDPARRPDRCPGSATGVRGAPERLSLRRLLGLAHGQSPAGELCSSVKPSDRFAPRPGRGPGIATPAPCPECGFDWNEDPLRGAVGGASARSPSSAGCSPADQAAEEAVDPGLWSASRYVWHTVDVLRFGTERLWTISADPSFGVPTWDENELADVRSYDELSPSSASLRADLRGRRLADSSRSRPRTTSPPAPGGLSSRLRRRPAQHARGPPSPVGHTTRPGG